MELYKIPLLELVSGFYDTLKSISQGFASIDYKILDFEDGKVLKQHIVFEDKIGRIRDIEINSKGEIFLINAV